STRRPGSIRRSPTRETRFILSRAEAVCSLTGRVGFRWGLVRFCSLPPARRIGLKAFHPISLFGLLSTDQREAKRVPDADYYARWGRKMSFALLLSQDSKAGASSAHSKRCRAGPHSRNLAERLECARLAGAFHGSGSLFFRKSKSRLSMNLRVLAASCRQTNR